MAHPGRRPNRAWAYFSSSNVLAEASASIRFGPLGRVPPEDIDYNVFEVFLQSVGPGSVVLEIAPARDCTCAAITSLRDGLGSRVSSRESIARISSMERLNPGRSRHALKFDQRYRELYVHASFTGDIWTSAAAKSGGPHRH